MAKDDYENREYDLFDDDNVSESDEGSEGASAASPSSTLTPTLSSSDIESPQQDYYSYMADWNNVMPLESDEDYAKRRRRAKNAALFGAISDGIASLANLWGTTRYGKSFYNADTPTMTGKVLERYDKMEDERKKDKAAWAQGAQRARQMDEAKKERDRSWKLTLDQWAHQQERDANNERRAAEEHAWKRELHPAQMKAAGAQAEAAANQATISGAQAAHAEEKAALEIKALKESIAASRRKASGGSGKTSKEPLIVYDGEGGYIVNSNDKNWESDVKACAEAAGIKLQRTTTKIVTNEYGGQTTTETVEDVPVTELNAALRNKGIEVLKKKAEADAAASGGSGKGDGYGGSGKGKGYGD